MLALLIQQAAGEAWKPGPHSIRKRELRGSHNSNDRLDDAFDELQGTLLRIETVAPDGRAAALLAFESRYAVTLYERGALLVGRRDPTWHGTVDELREVMGIPAGRYRDWGDIRRKAVEPACVKVNQLAEFACGWKVEQGPRNKVLSVELWFRPKDQAGRATAERELAGTREGRKARRQVQAAPPLQTDLVEALTALRAGRAPPEPAE